MFASFTLHLGMDGEWRLTIFWQKTRFFNVALLNSVCLFYKACHSSISAETSLTPLTHASPLNKHQTKRVYSINWHSLCCLTFADASCKPSRFLLPESLRIPWPIVFIPTNLFPLWTIFYFVHSLKHITVQRLLCDSLKTWKESSPSELFVQHSFFNQKIVLSFNFAAFLHCAMWQCASHLVSHIFIAHSHI